LRDEGSTARQPSYRDVICDAKRTGQCSNVICQMKGQVLSFGSSLSAVRLLTPKETTPAPRDQKWSREIIADGDPSAYVQGMVLV
jgi:hypothetical protein